MNQSPTNVKTSTYHDTMNAHASPMSKTAAIHARVRVPSLVTPCGHRAMRLALPANENGAA